MVVVGHAARLPRGLRHRADLRRPARGSCRWTWTRAEIGRNRPIEVGIVGDARSVLEAARGGRAARAGRRGVARVPARRRRPRAPSGSARYEESDQRPIHHFRLAKALDTVASRAGDVTFVGDGGNVVAVAAKVLKVRKPGRWLDPGPLGCLGVGAPFAIAAKLLAPERPVCVVQGDGAFGLNGFDFETAVRFGLPMVVVVGQRRGLGADPRPAARPVRRRPRRRDEARADPLRPRRRGVRRARASTWRIRPTSCPRSSGRSRRGRSTAWTWRSTRRRRRRAGRRGTQSSDSLLGSGPPRRGGSPRR